MKLSIIKAVPGHFAQLQQIELAAFAGLLAEGAVTGCASATDDAGLTRYLEADALYVAEADGEQIVGFCGGYLQDNWLHIAEMDVHPDWQRRGIGRMLMKTMLQRVKESHLQGASLTTDRRVPFNAPFYQSLGFRILGQAECPQRLRRLLDAEISAGFDPARRVAMLISADEINGE